MKLQLLSFIASARERGTLKHGRAWVILSLALGVHVADEAINDFLSVYNPVVTAIRTRAPFLPLPVFSFGLWLTGLICAVCLLLVLSVFVFRGSGWTVPVSWLLGSIMVVNAMIHILASIYQGQPMPGLYSSPLLLVSSFYLLSAIPKGGERASRPG